jgi:hypothetical protein
MAYYGTSALRPLDGREDQEGESYRWRCEHPDRYPGYCHCVPDLLDDLLAAARKAKDALR